MLFLVLAMTIAVMVMLAFASVHLFYQKKIVAAIAIQAGIMFMFGLSIMLMVLIEPTTANLVSPDRNFDTPQQFILAIPFVCAIALAVMSLAIWTANWLMINEVRMTRDTTSVRLSWSSGGTFRKIHQPKDGFTKRLTGREPDLDSNPNPWTPEQEMRKIG